MENCLLCAQITDRLPDYYTNWWCHKHHKKIQNKNPNCCIICGDRIRDDYVFNSQTGNYDFIEKENSIVKCCGMLVHRKCYYFYRKIKSLKKELKEVLLMKEDIMNIIKAASE